VTGRGSAASARVGQGNNLVGQGNNLVGHRMTWWARVRSGEETMMSIVEMRTNRPTEGLMSLLLAFRTLREGL